MREEHKVPYGVSEIIEIANRVRKEAWKSWKKSLHNRTSDLSSKK